VGINICAYICGTLNKSNNKNMKYEKRDPYYLERHRNALDLNFTYIGNDKYKLPAYWGDGDIVVDLSATGKEQFQILKSVVIQLISMYKSLE
jgi:hypothetical protein